MENRQLQCLIHKPSYFLVFFLSLFITNISAQERIPGRLFPPDRIFLLEEPRDWQNTEQIMEKLHVKAGDIVADIGAGSGYFTIPLTSQVGEKGMVFAVDIQVEMVNFITRKIDALGLNNVRVIFGKAEDPSLLDNFFDLIFLANTYHELEKPYLMLENIKEDLRYHGRLAIIDWDPAKKSPFGPPLNEKIPEDVLIKEVERTGFYLVEKHNIMPYHYFLIFKKKNYE